MVSPSKHQRQQQQHRQPSRENKSNPRASHIRIQKGQKPLENKSFYLDIKNHATAAKLEAKIRQLGGAIELFLVRSVSLVVSDRVDKTGHTNSENHKWGSVSGGSGGPRSLKSIEVQTPTPTPPTPFLSSECPSSNSTNLRGQTAQRSKSRVDAMLERALTQPQQCSVDPLDNAQNWGIPIWATDKLQAWLDKIYASFKDTCNLKHLKQINKRNSDKDLKVKYLKGPYIKFEAYHRNTRPVFLELSAWPTLNFDGDLGSCPFDTKKQRKLENKLINKEVKENKEDIESINKEGREMTRRPRATTTRARRTEQLVGGYCEICRVHYDDLSKHVQSEQHLNFVRNDDNFLALDTLINAGANVEAFLKLNRTNDIGQDCNLFPNGDNNLHNVVLPEEKVTKNAKTLSNFGVDEIKMVQCNGTRRNLNLKLNSPHNLRARAKHESGHLLRSKGSPWHEVDKNDKFYDKLEGFTIKKRSKGTIWIEEEDPDDKYTDDILKEPKQEDYKIKPFSKGIDGVVFHPNQEDNTDTKHIDPQNLQQAIVRNSTQNGIINSHHISENLDYFKNKNHEEYNGDENVGPLECTISENGVMDNNYTGSCKVFKDEIFQRENYVLQTEAVDAKTFVENTNGIATEIICNGHNAKNGQKDFKASPGEITRYEKSKHPKFNRRGGRNVRGRHRLSVEERLIEDNRAYYKVEVLGNKLRSSAMPGCNSQHSMCKDVDGEEKKDVPSSEKPVVVRFKRVRKSELSLLSDEAESFMFGELKRDDSSETSDGEQSSVLPRDTESESNEVVSFMLSSSPLNSPVKQEIIHIEEDSQDSVHLGRVRKRRRTQAEAFIKDNTDYYKFETPGSRLRYQAPLTGIKESEEHAKKSVGAEDYRLQVDIAERTYPSKPSAEIEKMQFSFEAIPKSEPWYQTYQRQDAGAEFWHYFSEGDTMKPFLLPYEIENFHETLMKNQCRMEGRKRGRGRGIGSVGRSPRKSPRCHASTLAIMSTIIRKREQQQHSTTLCTIEESPAVRSCTNTPTDQKQDLKSDIDEELKEMAKTIDEMLNTKDMLELDNSFEPDDMQTDLNLYGSNIPKGAPPNLLELLDNCQDIANCLENSSCASSECGEGNPEFPLKRRKRRKNRTGWPGNKMKKKLPNNKAVTDPDCDREILTRKRLYPDNKFVGRHTVNMLNKVSKVTDIVMSNSAMLPTIAERLNINQKGDIDALLETCIPNTCHKSSCHEGLTRRDKSIETTNDTGLPTSAESYMESSISEMCNDMDRNYLLNEDYPYRKDLSEIEEISENDPGNDENHENLFRKDVNIAISERNFISKSPIKKRQRENTTSDTCELHTEIENQDVLCRKDTESGIVPRKHHNGLSPKRRRKDNSENPNSELERHSGVYRRSRMASRKRIYSRKRQVKACQSRPANNLSSDTVYEDENCKKDSYLSITCKKQPNMRTMKRKSEAISSDLQESDLECALDRVSPTVISPAELEQRRSSIEFQPVVRMMKIDDQVDMDHSILSVTVASNRRLRSSSSPRSNAKPPKKRLKSGRGQFGRWLKSS